jgi:hypothetical protein
LWLLFCSRVRFHLLLAFRRACLLVHLSDVCRGVGTREHSQLGAVPAHLVCFACPVLQTSKSARSRARAIRGPFAKTQLDRTTAARTSSPTGERFRTRILPCIGVTSLRHDVECVVFAATNCRPAFSPDWLVWLFCSLKVVSGALTPADATPRAFATVNTTAGGQIIEFSECQLRAQLGRTACSCHRALLTPPQETPLQLCPRCVSHSDRSGQRHHFANADQPRQPDRLSRHHHARQLQVVRATGAF